MNGLSDSSTPKLAAGCRWGGSAKARVVLFPEGAIRVQGTGLRILELCDGNRTFAQVVTELHKQYSHSAAERIQDDARRFLEQLHEKRILDF
jgi:pyrroloquinoline quinone biosynthesis protein D